MRRPAALPAALVAAAPAAADQAHDLALGRRLVEKAPLVPAQAQPIVLRFAQQPMSDIGRKQSGRLRQEGSL